MMDAIFQRGVDWMERGLLPDFLVRYNIRKLCAQRLREENKGDCGEQQQVLAKFIADMDTAPIAPLPQKANEQHYELPSVFFGYCLGKHRKYSSCFFPDGETSLDKAEAIALTETCEHAELKDGIDVLELGCGWGSLSLWMAERYPNSKITGVSNSAPQREYILHQAHQRGLSNLTILTADMNSFELDQQFDRVVSVEMFEHMRNHRMLMNKVSHWLRDEGKFFMHIFVHKEFAYEFQTQGDDNWLGKYFFTGGMMPSDELPLHFQEDLRILKRWRWNGTHYQKTANAWLANMDRNRDKIMPILIEVYGNSEAHRWFNRWRVFYIACAELWGYRNGQEWWVSHYLFEKHPVVVEEIEFQLEDTSCVSPSA